MKDDGQTTYVPGTPISYTITVTNAGPSTANGVSLTDTVPAAITDVTVTCAVTGTGSCGTDGSAGNAVSFTDASLAPGAANALTLTVSGTVSPSATGPLVNTVTVTADAGSTDTNPGNNSATDTDTAGIAQVDLGITKTDGQESYVPGTPISYTLTVTNAGPSSATGFSIADVVPPAITGVTVLCAATGTGDCGANGSSGNSISFTNASLAAGAGHALTLTVSGTIAPDAIGALVNTATVAPGAGSTDANPANDSATDTDTRGAAQVDLAITKTDGQPTYVPGTAITYTIVVTNAGPSTATGFSIADPVPAAITGVTVVCAVTGDGTCGTNGTLGGTVSFTNASLSPGAGNALTLTVRGTIGPSTSGETPQHRDRHAGGRRRRREPRQRQRDRHRYARHVTDRSGRHEDRWPDDLRAGHGDHLHDHRDQRGTVVRHRLQHHRHGAGGDHGRDGELRGHRHGQLRHERLLGQHRQLHRCERRTGRGQRDHAHGEPAP